MDAIVGIVVVVLAVAVGVFAWSSARAEAARRDSEAEAQTAADVLAGLDALRDRVRTAEPAWLVDQLARTARLAFGAEACRAALSSEGVGMVAGPVVGGPDPGPVVLDLLQQALDEGRAVELRCDPLPVLALPLVAGGRAVGAVAVVGAGEAGPLAEQTRRTFLGVVAQTVGAQALADGASLDHGHDPVTGLPTRSAMEPLLAEVRAGDSVVLFELDGGRSSASLIAAFGRHLRASLREKDVVGRWDRGSFLAHIPVPGPIAQERVERIRTSWAAASAGPGFSAGVAMHDGASVERTVEAAAAALRQAREAGGGRTWANAG